MKIDFDVLQPKIIEVMNKKKTLMENLSGTDDIVQVELANTAIRKFSETVQAHMNYLKQFQNLADQDVRRINIKVVDTNYGAINEGYEATIKLIETCISYNSNKVVTPKK